MVIVALAWQGLLIGHLAWRLRHDLGRVGRQQIRWLLVAMTVALVAGQLYRVLSLAVTDATGDVTARYAYDLVAIPLMYLAYIGVPLALTLSMLHHRLYDIDLVVHRALVYVPVAAVLAGILAVTLFIAQGAVVAITGERSELVTAVATLVVVAAFEPVRAGVTALVDRAFLRVRDPAADARALEREVTSVLDVLDRQRLASRLLATVSDAYEPTGAAVLVNDDAPLHRLAATPGWDGSAQVILPLMVDGRRIGTLALGERRRASGYTDRDLDALGDLAGTIARALDRAKA
jgi:GAF domain-containing protein